MHQCQHRLHRHLEAFLQSLPGICKHTGGRPAWVVGGSGAARSAIQAFWKWLNASEVYLLNRLNAEVEEIIGLMLASGFPGKLTHVTSAPQATQRSAPALIARTTPDLLPKSSVECLARAVVM